MSTLNEAGQRLGLLEAVISGGDAGDDELREYVMLLIAQRASPEPEPAQSALLMVADIADHFSRLTGKPVSPDLVHHWRARNPSCPAPVLVVGVRKPVEVWLGFQLPDWEAWKRDDRPGRGGRRDGQAAPAGKPARAPLAGLLLTTADIADRLAGLISEAVSADLVMGWRGRNGPDRTAAEIAKAPSCPQPVLSAGVRRPVDVYLPSQLPDWEVWYREQRPGRGKGGGRPSGS